MQFAKLNNVYIHYNDEGSDSGLPVIFSNSLGTDFRIWDDLIATLNVGGAGELRFIRYDKRGHGLSDAPQPPYSMDDHVNDLIALMDHLNIEKAMVIGLSVGGMIAQSIAHKIPHRINALVLSNTAHKIGNAELWNDRISMVNEGGIKPISESILERWFSPNFHKTEQTKLAIYRNMLERTTPEGYTGTGAAIRDCDLTDSTRNLSVPTLLIAGSMDGATPPELMASTHKLISKSKFEIIDGAGHLPCIEQPVETGRLILEFMEDNALV